MWEIVRDVEALRAADAKDPVRRVVRSTGLGEDQVRLALAYHARYPQDSGRRIAAAEALEQALAAVEV